ncbi:MAG: carbohydrate kinase [Lachnospiraceae bacterium]|nr:carbohydrate kinase [Lachnospiraceae bacterium]
MKLTVFGEILWDITEDEKNIGGAPFNFAAHAARQGADVCLITAVGNDESGDEALRECERMNLPTDCIARVDRPTGSCRVQLQDGTPAYDLSGDMAYDHIPLPECFKSMRVPSKREPSAFYFGTLAQRSSDSRETLKELLKRREFFDEVFLDINIRQDYYSDELIDESIRAATILKISRDEIYVLNIPGEPQDICRQLSRKYKNLKMIIVTLDSDGAFVYEKGGRITRSGKPDCEVVSAVGAGDAFSAAFLVNYMNRLSVRECLKRAVALAGRVCGKVEAVPTYLMDDVRKWKAVYRLLDHVETETFDCGTLCGSACCMCRDAEKEMGIYLFPGEHLLLRESEKEQNWLTWERQDPAEIGFPESWEGPVYFVNCQTPPKCPRKWRPLQCRTFPLKPVIGESGVLEMIWDDDELPYTCPIIEKNMPIHDSFYKDTYTVWTHLLKDPRILDLVLSWS